MAWDKKTWVTGEVITADKLNRLEDGVEEALNDGHEEASISKNLDALGVSQEGTKGFILTPNDFSTLYSAEYALVPDTTFDAAQTRSILEANAYWNVYRYDFERPVIVRFDKLILNSNVPGVIALAFQYESINWTMDSVRIGQYYIVQSILANCRIADEAFAFNELGITVFPRRDFNDVVVCGNHISEFTDIVVFGDSIAANYVSAIGGNQPVVGNGVIAQLGSLMGLPVHNHAVGGATLTTNQSDPKNIVTQVNDYLLNPDGGSRPLYIIAGGTNDYIPVTDTNGSLGKLGSYGATSTTTIYGAIHTILIALLGPNGLGIQPWQILIITPIPKGISSSYRYNNQMTNVSAWLASIDCNLTSIGHAMYEVGCAYLCNVINGYHTIYDTLSGGNVNFASDPYYPGDIRVLLMPDDTHPSELGAALYAHYIYNAVNGKAKGIEDKIAGLKNAYASGQRIKSQGQIVNGDRLQTGRVHITLTPDDFELMESGKYIYADGTGVHFGTNPDWSIYSFKFGTHNIFPLTSPAGAYHYGERVVFRLDKVKRDTSVTNAVALACRFGESTYYVLTESAEGQYYTGEELIISVHNAEAVLESVSLTATVCRDFEDNVVCSKYLKMFDRIEVFGDSIFANYVSIPTHTEPTPTDIRNGVTAQFASLMGLPINNHAYPGATLSTLLYDDPPNVVQQVYAYVQASSTGHEIGTPLYLIDGGTNDQYFYNLTNLGVYGSDDITTICGAIKNIIEVLVSFGAEPWQIVVTTPIPKGITWSTVGLASMDSELTAIGYAIYQIGLALGVNVINGYRSVFNNLDDPNAKYIMMPDDTHPSELGSLLYAHRIYNALGGNMREVDVSAVQVSGDDYELRLS